MPPVLSPIDYEWVTLAGDEISLSFGLGAYNMLYVFKSETKGSKGVLFIGNTFLHSLGQESPWKGIKHTLQSDTGSSPCEANHPGPPWSCWREDGRHPGYRVLHDNRVIQCLYIRYSVYDGIPYKLGTEGVGQQQFTRELFAGLQRAINVPGISNKDLKIFTQNLPFNFALK